VKLYRKNSVSPRLATNNFKFRLLLAFMSLQNSENLKAQRHLKNLKAAEDLKDLIPKFNPKW
jgi:hypothetical protein